MTETFVIPDYGFTVEGQPDRVKRLSPGSTAVVLVDGKQITEPTSIKKSVRVTGRGYVTLADE